MQSLLRHFILTSSFHILTSLTVLPCPPPQSFLSLFLLIYSCLLVLHSQYIFLPPPWPSTACPCICPRQPLSACLVLPVFLYHTLVSCFPIKHYPAIPSLFVLSPQPPILLLPSSCLLSSSLASYFPSQPLPVFLYHTLVSFSPTQHSPACPSLPILSPQPPILLLPSPFLLSSSLALILLNLFQSFSSILLPPVLLPNILLPFLPSPFYIPSLLSSSLAPYSPSQSFSCSPCSLSSAFLSLLSLFQYHPTSCPPL